MGSTPTAQDSAAPAGPRGWRWLSSGLTLTTLLTALLFVQGRAYRSGYLEALGISESQFPITTTDALWLAFNGWLMGAVQIAGASWQAFKTQLLGTGIWLFLVVFAMLCLLVFLGPSAPGIRQWFKSKVVAQQDGVNGSKSSTRWKFGAITAGAMAATIGSIAVFPLALFLGAFVLMFSFIILVYPFFSLGAQAADDFCEKPLATASVVMLLDQSSPAYLLECGTQFCALLDGRGSRFVVPVGQVARVDIRNRATVDPSNAARCSLQRTQAKSSR